MQNLTVAEFLPDIALPSVPDGSLVSLREAGGRTTVVLTVHDAGCADCQAYADQLAGISGEFEVWDARLLVIVPASVEEAARLQGYGKVLADEHGRLAEPGSASVTVADRYGHIFYTVGGDASHNLPSAPEITEWLKYLGTLCPE
jgi:hypothetical protein